MRLASPPLLLAITLLGAALRLFQIGKQGLWVDEALSVWMAQHGLSTMLAGIVRAEPHPPLHFLLLHAWMRWWGASDTSVRLLSALFSILTIPVMFLLARRLAGIQAGLVAALILALSPFHVRFAQEARMYALLAFLATLAMYSLACLLTAPRALAWAGYVTSSAAAVLCHSTAVFLLLGANLVVAILSVLRRRLPPGHGQLRPPSLKSWLAAQAGVLLLWSCWLPAFVEQSRRVYSDFWLPSPTALTVLATIQGFLVELSSSRPAFLVIALASWILAGLLAWRARAHLRSRPAHLVFLSAFFLTPLLGELLVSLVRPIFYDRTLIWASVPLYVLLATGLDQLRSRHLAAGVLVSLLAMNAAGLHSYRTDRRNEQWREAAEHVARHVQDGDLVLIQEPWSCTAFCRYFDPLNHRRVVARGLAGSELEPCASLIENNGKRDELRSTLGGHSRVWLVFRDYAAESAPAQAIATLGERFRLLERRELHRLQVRLYGR